MKILILPLMISALTLPLLLKAEATLTDEQVNFFERKIRPVLSEKCYECHSATAKKIKGGLKLDTKEAVMHGGENGPAVVPGKPDDSLLIEAIRYTNKDNQMPPSENTQCLSLCKKVLALVPLC